MNTKILKQKVLQTTLSGKWETVKLGEVCDVKMGQSPDGQSVSKDNSGIEFHQGKICFTNKFLRESDVYTNQPTKIAEAHSLLLCVRAPVGVVNITERKICIGRGLCAINPKKEVDSMFVYYWLQTMEQEFNEKATGTTFKAISGAIIRNSEIPLPPLAVQKSIVERIETLFAEIDRIEQSRQNLLQAVKLARQKVLAELLNNDEWESVKLGEVCEKICAGGDKPNCFSEIKTEKCSIPIYSNGINNNGLYGYTDVPTIIKPSVTISARGTIGFTAIRRTPFCPIIRLVSVTPKEEILDLNFLYYVLNAFIAKGEGSSIPQLTVPNVKPIQIPFPPLTVQQQIVAKIERIFAEIERIEKAVKIK